MGLTNLKEMGANCFEIIIFFKIGGKIYFYIKFFGANGSGKGALLLCLGHLVLGAFANWATLYFLVAIL